jgi:hypothetical protein
MTKRLMKYQTIFSFVLLFIPLILWIATGELRPSISNYAYSSQSNLFVMLLTLAASVFLVSGNFDDKTKLGSYQPRSKWYNFILGGSLVGVALTPHLDYPIWHYTFASTFFLGSVAVMILFSSEKQRVGMIFTGLLIVTAMVMHFILNLFTLYWAEFLGMLPITIHMIGETLDRID